MDACMRFVKYLVSELVKRLLLSTHHFTVCIEPEWRPLHDHSLEVTGEHEVVDEVAGHHEGPCNDHGDHAVVGDHQKEHQCHREGQGGEVEGHGGCWCGR